MINTFFSHDFVLYISQSSHPSWQRLSSKVTVTHDNLPNNVRVVYTPHCEHAGPAGASEGVCDNVRTDNEVSSFSSVDVHGAVSVYINFRF